MVATFFSADPNYSRGVSDPVTYLITPHSFTYQIGNDNHIYGSPSNHANDLGTTVFTGVNGENLDITYSSAGDAATASVGVYPITGTFSDGTGALANYSVIIQTGLLTVNPAPLTVNVASVTKTYGQDDTASLTGTILGIHNGDPITASYTSAGSAATASVAGSPYPIDAMLLDGGTGVLTNYGVTIQTGLLTVNPATPVITWANPPDIVYGTSLSAAQLDATATSLFNDLTVTVPGTFIYAPAAGSILTAGNNQVLSEHFVPSDILDYSTPADQSVSINVDNAPTTTTANAASANASSTSQNITLSASVTTSSAVGTVNEGTVTFSVFDATGTTQIGSSVTSGTVTSGNSSAIFSLPANTSLGTYQIHALYNPGPDFIGSNDNGHVLTVGGASTTVASVAVGTQSRSATYGTGRSVSYAITVAASATGTNAPNVALSIAGLPSGVLASFLPASLPTSGGTATLTLTTLATTPAGAYSFSVTAAASNVLSQDGTLTINKANQTISFVTLPTKTYGDSDFTINATASSGLPVTFTATGNATVSLIGGLWIVHITGAGSATVTAHQAGNTNYNAAANVSRTLTVSKASQTITFAPLSTRTYGDSNFAINATASSGLPVTFTATGNATVSQIGGIWIVHITGAGSATITAHQPGNSNYNSAPNVSQILTINKASPTFNNLSSPGITHGTNVSATISGHVGAATLNATGSVVITITGNGVSLQKTVSLTNGNFLWVVTRAWLIGTYTITYHYAGNSNFNPIAPDGATSLVVS